jgi:hypothetical protein
VMTWENRADSYWIPYPGHAASADFAAFATSDSVLLLDEAGPLYAVPHDGFPMCERCSADTDGDGWGWENGRSCRVGSWCLGLGD